MFGLYLIVTVCMIICPISALVVIIAVCLNYSILNRTYWSYLIFSLLGILCFYFGYKLAMPVIPFLICREYAARILSFMNIQAEHVDLRTYIISDLRTIGLCMFIEMVALYMTTRTPEVIMMDKERRRENEKLRVQKIDYIPKRSQLIVGVSGAGKTAYISKSIEEILNKDPTAFIVIVDGKGSTEKYSLYYSCKLIARKMKQKLFILNGTTNRKLGGILYDFLEGVDTTDSMKDMVMSLMDDPTIKASAGSEHYKVMTERYLLELMEFMQESHIDVTLLNLMKIVDPSDLAAAMDNIKADPDRKKAILNFAESAWRDVHANIEKIKMFLRGQGSIIFTGKGKRMNIRKAYKQGASVLLVLADEMSMPSLAPKLVQLVTMDIRNLVAARLTGTIDMNRKVYVLYDEFSSYTSSVPLVKSLYARARSSDTILTLATQSCSDLIALGKGWFDTIVDTADRFVVFRQNSGEAAESAAAVFGTEIHVTDTARSSNLQSTGEASNTLDRTYVIPPDMIRNLKTNYGFLLDKTQKKGQQVKYFKNKFVQEV